MVHKHVYVEKYCYQPSPGEGEFFHQTQRFSPGGVGPNAFTAGFRSMVGGECWSTVGSSCDVAIFFFRNSWLKMKCSWKNEDEMIVVVRYCIFTTCN